MPLSSGTTLGRYKVDSLLGAGGMGEVYLAHDIRLNRKIALKVLPADVTNNRERLHRFEQEARAASALNHPNILTIHEIGEENGTHFISTEFIEGETLRQKLQTRLEIEETLNIATQIAAALDAAHKSGIVHRDIKPENVIVREDGLVKVLDFGLAKLTEKKEVAPADSQAPTRAQVQTSPGVVMGTIAYMSPEQARGKEIDARTDIFSFGAVLYEMLAGRRPFSGETTADVMGALLFKEPPPLKELAPDSPAELQHIISKALRKDADERYQTIKSLLADLKTLKQELEFAAKLERSAASERSKAASAAESPGTSLTANAALSSASTQAATARPTSSAEDIASGIKQRKGSIIIALALLVLTALGLCYWYLGRSSPTTTPIESIAVLPFKNESGNPDVEYLSDGMTESLINSLSQLPKLSVKARSTVFHYKGREADPQKVGSELNVQAVLNGRVVQRGDDLALYLSLVDARNGNQLWGEQYNRKMTDIVSLQSEIARDVSGKLKTKLSGTDEQKIAKTYTTNPEAYRLYLQGRFYWNKREEKEFRKAVEYYNQAIALDPNYAQAYAGLADTYALLSSYSFMPPTEAIPKALEFARRALSLDEGLAEPHATLGYVSSQYERDFAGAERELKRALELNPNYATAHQWYGEVLTYLGRFDESFAAFRRALEIEPLSLPINWDYGRCLYMGRKYDESLTQLKKTIELDGGFARAHRTLAELYRIRKEYANALEEQARFYELRGETQNAALVRESFARGGWSGYLRLVTAENSLLKENNWAVARAYLELGEKEKAITELNKAYENRVSGLSWLKVEPQLDPLRSDPRFQDLLRRVGFPQ